MKKINNISYASKENAEEIISLFNICFPENEDFTQWFFKNISCLENILIYKENDEILAMLQEIPVKLSSSEKATYIYGACTRPSHRKEGLMAELLNYSFENDLKKEIPVSVLIPENKKLFDYYKKFGYTPATPIRKELFERNSTFSLSDKNKYTFRKALFSDIENINFLYNKILDNSIFISREKFFWEKQLEMFSHFNESCFCLYDNEKSELAAYAFVWNEENPFAQEICFKNDTAKNIICGNILEYYRIPKLTLNIYDKKGDYAACIKRHDKATVKTDYIINMLWN